MDQDFFFLFPRQSFHTIICPFSINASSAPNSVDVAAVQPSRLGVKASLFPILPPVYHRATRRDKQPLETNAYGHFGVPTSPHMHTCGLGRVGLLPGVQPVQTRREHAVPP